MSRSAPWCVCGLKQRCTIFIPDWARCGYLKKLVGTRYTKLVFCMLWDIWVTYCVSLRLGHETSMHDFHAWVGLVRIQQKGCLTCYTELVFLPPVGSMCHVLHSGASEARNNNELFFIPDWAWHGYHKKHVRTRYAELVFLHQQGSMDHVVRSGASGA
jgi:hypothetical protein